MRTIRILLSLIVVPAAVVNAQQADSLAEIRRQITILTEEIEQLKLGSVDDPSYEPVAGFGPAASKVYSLKKSGVSLAGYGEMLYQNIATTRDDKTPATSKDQVDYLRNILYVGYRFNDRVLFNSEVEFEHASTGKGGEVSVEFAYIDVLLSPEINVRSGMLLVPVGIVNEKHEPPTFFGTDRSGVEKTIIPSTWRANGAGIFGRLAGGFDYRAYLVESLRMDKYAGSDGIRGGRQSGAKAIAEDLGLTGRMSYKGLPGADIGVSFFTGNAGQGEIDSLGSRISARTTVTAVHAEYAWNGFELRGLFARTSVDEAERVAGYLRWKSGASVALPIGNVMSGWYASAGYDLLPLLMEDARQSLAPFVQYEWYDTHSSVPSGFSKNTSFQRSALIVGLLWKPHPNVAFKADYRDNANGAGTGTDQWNMAMTYLY